MDRGLHFAMPRIALAHQTDWEGWRAATRRMAVAGVPPEELTWTIGHASAEPDEPPATGDGFRVSRALVDLAAVVIQAREPERFGLLYSLVWRTNAGEKPLEDPDDADVRWACALAHSVRAETHRMRAHLRFMPLEDRLLGWYAPAHFVLEPTARLLARQFPKSVFSILTPDGSAHWDGGEPRFGPGARNIGDDDTLRAWWDAHRAALLRDTWGGSNLPEAEAFDKNPRSIDLPPIGPVVLPPVVGPDLAATQLEAATCQRCDLHRHATQTVFGEGPANARALFVGEQPGDQEDTIGRPFVGPAGQLLDRAMEEASLDRRGIYITNSVKHFKFTQRGRRRIHQTPDVAEIQACSFWLDVERKHLEPRLLVIMGASAARAVLRRAVTVTRERGRVFAMPNGQMAFITVHPSYLLRIPDEAGKAREYAAFVRDIAAVRDWLESDG
jgi:probable DNA metabolism protein